MASDKKKPHDNGGDGKPQIHQKEMAAEYGFALAFMNSDKELKSLFSQAVANTWTPDKFAAQLRGTKWFQTHSAAVRNAIVQKTADPQTWQSNLDKMQSTVRDQWGQLFGDAPVSDKTLNRWAATAQTMGWSQAQLVDHMADAVNWKAQISSSQLGGTAAQTKAQLEQLTNQYGVSFGSHWTNKQIEDVVRGDQTVSGLQEQVKALAKQTYGAFANQLDSGMTMQQIADPYVQKMSELLEVNPNSVSLKNGLLQKALTMRSQDGKPAAMSITDFANAVRQDPRWAYTDNAKQQVAGATMNLLQTWGLA